MVKMTRIGVLIVIVRLAKLVDLVAAPEIAQGTTALAGAALRPFSFSAGARRGWRCDSNSSPRACHLSLITRHCLRYGLGLLTTGERGDSRGNLRSFGVNLFNGARLAGDLAACHEKNEKKNTAFRLYRILH